MAKELPVAGGVICFVDDDDFPRLSGFSWCLNNGYVGTASGGKFVYLHRLLTGAGPGDVTDHRDGNRLNNTRANLRLCSRTENNRNGPSRGGSSQFKGVYRSRCYGRKWKASITCNRRQIHLGYFDEEVEAARAYDAAAVRLHGDFARTNFPQVPHE